MKKIIESISLYDIEKVKNDFYFTENGRQNAINSAQQYNKMILLGEVNNDLKYINYIQGIIMPYIITEDNRDEWRDIRHKLCENKYSMTVEYYNQLKRAKTIDKNICDEI